MNAKWKNLEKCKNIFSKKGMKFTEKVNGHLIFRRNAITWNFWGTTEKYWCPEIKKRGQGIESFLKEIEENGCRPRLRVKKDDEYKPVTTMEACENLSKAMRKTGSCWGGVDLAIKGADKTGVIIYQPEAQKFQRKFWWKILWGKVKSLFKRKKCDHEYIGGVITRERCKKCGKLEAIKYD